MAAAFFSETTIPKAKRSGIVKSNYPVQRPFLFCQLFIIII